MKEVGAIFALILALLIVGAFLNSFSVLQQANQKIGSSGTLETVGTSAWKDITLKNPLTFIDWGFVWPQSNKTFTCYFRNDRNTETTLILETENWNPKHASKWLNLSWNLNNISFEPNQTLTTHFFLTVSPDTKNITKFSFNIIVKTQSNSEAIL